jgi:hypothetical protein
MILLLIYFLSQAPAPAEETKQEPAVVQTQVDVKQEPKKQPEKDPVVEYTDRSIY